MNWWNCPICVSLLVNVWSSRAFTTSSKRPHEHVPQIQTISNPIAVGHSGPGLELESCSGFYRVLRITAWTEHFQKITTSEKPFSLGVLPTEELNAAEIYKFHLVQPGSSPDELPSLITSNIFLLDPFLILTDW